MRRLHQRGRGMLDGLITDGFAALSRYHPSRPPPSWCSWRSAADRGLRHHAPKADVVLYLPVCVCGSLSPFDEGKHIDCIGMDFDLLFYPADDRRSAAVQTSQCRLRQGMEIQVEPN
jgi:hypothetical protein